MVFSVPPGFNIIRPVNVFSSMYSQCVLKVHMEFTLCNRETHDTSYLKRHQFLFTFPHPHPSVFSRSHADSSLLLSLVLSPSSFFIFSCSSSCTSRPTKPINILSVTDPSACLVYTLFVTDVDLSHIGAVWPLYLGSSCGRRVNQDIPCGRCFGERVV